MEFHDLGRHCSSEHCGRQDFLPFKCDACAQVFCLDHRSHTAHSCTNANFNDKRVLECSKCNKVLRRPPGVEHSILLQRHLASGCVDGVRKARPNRIRCSVQGCRGSEFVKVECTSCRRNFCFKHRHEEDHKCEATAEASRREHPHLQKRGVGRTGVPKDKAATANPAGKPDASAAGDDRPCRTEAGEAAARREREATAAGGAGIAAR